MSIYIRSTAAITPVSHPAVSQFGDALVCADPELGSKVDPRLTRRMSHVIRLGVAAALQSLDAAGISQPDAIITGTAYGCLEDTGIFLKKQIQQQESMLTPTSFIQSTHNTVGGQIGLLLHCNGYNNTFVHRGFSFEHAIQDAMMLLEENAAKNVLVGAVDEMTVASHAILERFGLFRHTTGGEGSAFFVLTSNKDVNVLAELKEVATLYKPSPAVVISFIAGLLKQNQLLPADIGLFAEGKNGDGTADSIYDEVYSSLFDGIQRMSFKNECGEFPTASAIGLHKAAVLTTAPEKILAGPTSVPKYTLLYNHYQNIHHSIYLLQAC